MPIIGTPASAACSDFRLFISGLEYTIPISTGYYFTIGSSQAAWSTANPTQVLNDGSAGDSTTGISADRLVNSGTIALTAFYDAGSSKQLIGHQFTITDGVANYTYWLFEGSNDTTTWTTLGGGVNTVTGTPVTIKYSTFNWSTFRYYRLSVYCTGQNNQLTLWDWRLTLASPPANDATLSGNYLGGGAAQLSWTP